MKITDEDLVQLLWMARRYAHERCTSAPHTFNAIYQTLMNENPGILEKMDKVDHAITTWPWAQDGFYDEDTGEFDAIPKNH